MADDKKPDEFEMLMRRMGQTMQFPFDPQPVNPAVGSEPAVTLHLGRAPMLLAAG